MEETAIRVAISDHGRTAWVAASTGELPMVNLDTWEFDQEFHLFTGNAGVALYDLVPLPGEADRLVAYETNEFGVLPGAVAPNQSKTVSRVNTLELGHWGSRGRPGQVVTAFGHGYPGQFRHRTGHGRV